MLDTIKKHFSYAAAVQVKLFFDNTGLPIPHDNEYTNTADGGVIVFNSRDAVVVRISQRDFFDDAENKMLLKPIASRFAESARIDINPGLECPAQSKDVLAAYKALKEKGWLLRDMKTQNLGHIPSAASGGIKTSPLIIDPGAVEKLSDSIKSIEFYKKFAKNLVLSLGTKTRLPDANQNIYDPLRDLFLRAWPAESTTANAQKMKEFWNFCRHMKDKSWMVCGWDDNPKVMKKNYKNARDGSKKYEKRLLECFF